MKSIGYVCSEGGPLLIADALDARSWRGAEGDGSDYEHVCQLFDANDVQGRSISFTESEGVTWELRGAGTGHIFAINPSCLKIVRVWIHEPDDKQSVFRLAELPMSEEISIGSVNIRSGVLALLWAAESGECIQLSDIEEFDTLVSTRPTGDMATGSSALLIKIPLGTYSCLHDEIQLSDGQSARRCHIIKHK